jgi:hypothetical protein
VSTITDWQRKHVKVSNRGLVSFDLLPSMATRQTGQCRIVCVGGRDCRAMGANQ